NLYNCHQHQNRFSPLRHLPAAISPLTPTVTYTETAFSPSVPCIPPLHPPPPSCAFGENSGDMQVGGSLPALVPLKPHQFLVPTNTQTTTTCSRCAMYSAYFTLQQNQIFQLENLLQEKISQLFERDQQIVRLEAELVGKTQQVERLEY